MPPTAPVWPPPPPPEPPLVARPPDRRALGRVVAIAAVLLFGGIALSKWEPYTFLHGDGAFYANINKSLWFDRSLDQTAYHPHSWLEDDLGWNKNLDQGWSNVSLGKDGRWLPKHSWVMPLLSTPLFGVFGLGGLLVFHVLMMALLAVSAYRIAARFVAPGYAAVATLLVAAQPVISGDVYSYNNDVFYSALLLAGTAAFLASIGAGELRAPQGQRRERLEIWAGLLFGLGVWAKVTNLVYVAPFAIWQLSRREWRSTRRCLIAFGVPIAVFLASNAALFGSPLTTSYSQIVVRKDGAMATESVAERFHEPLKEGLVRVLTNDSEGLDSKAPLIALAVVGAIALLAVRATRAPAAAFLCVVTLFLLVQAKYGFTYARFFLPVAGLSVMPIAGAFALAGAAARWLRSYLRPNLDDRRNPAHLALWLVLVVSAWAAHRRFNPPPNSDFTLTEHLGEARVMPTAAPTGPLDARAARRCDYFNNLHQKFECPGDKGSDQMWGRAVGKECSFDGTPQPLLFLHPPRARGARTISFDVPSGDRLRLKYGLAETSRFDDVVFEVRLGGIVLPLPPVTRRGELIDHEVRGLAGLSGPLTITVSSPPLDWRHFCIDATVLNGDTGAGP
jgi:hypothetical protein